jgi:asparagine synthase (glutamine-hydrolysing)
MEYRYLGFLSTRSTTASEPVLAGLTASVMNSHGARGWRCALASSGIVVFATAPAGRALKAYELPDCRGVILGRLFPAGAQTSIEDLRVDMEERSREIVRSGGDYLIDNYWGAYVALLRGEAPYTSFVVRDCSGTIPCFYTEYEGIQIVFSDIEDLACLAIPPFQVDPAYVAAFIYSSQMQIRKTGLSGVRELLAGERVKFDQDGAHVSCVWDPRRVVRTGRIDDYASARVSLEQTTQQCIDAWSSVFDNILFSLSGGLDSAIVLGCLNRTRVQPHVTCFNRYSEFGREDERGFARLAAAAAGHPLIEQPWYSTNRDIDGRALAIPLTPKPYIPLVMKSLDVDFTNALAERVNAEAVWSGEGGDHIFWQAHNFLPAADSLLHRGLLRSVQAIMDAAALSRQPYTAVLRSARELARSNTAWLPEYAADRIPYFVHPNTLPPGLLEYASHPWTHDAEDLPKGKQFQIYFLAEVVNRQRPIATVERISEFHPLLSQPLIELCLRIPSYLLVRGGRQRSLARDTFQDRVPPEIIQREAKGETTLSIVDRVRRSQPFVRELLLDGVLAKQGFVDRASLARHLVSNEPLRLEHIFPFLACITAEIWMRRISGAWLKQRAAA